MQEAKTLSPHGKPTSALAVSVDTENLENLPLGADSAYLGAVRRRSNIRRPTGASPTALRHRRTRHRVTTASEQKLERQLGDAHASRWQRRAEYGGGAGRDQVTERAGAAYKRLKHWARMESRRQHSRSV